MKISSPKKTHRLNRQPVYINRPFDVFAEVGPSLLAVRAPYRNRKQFWTIGLAGSNKVTHIELLSIGNRTYSVVDTSEVFRTQIQKGAEKVILVSNCPAGNRLYPTKREKTKTADLMHFGNALKVTMIDFVIISDRTYYSFAEETKLPGYKVK